MRWIAPLLFSAALLAEESVNQKTKNLSGFYSFLEMHTIGESSKNQKKENRQLQEKHVITSTSSEGLFSSFICVLHNIMWAESHNKIPVVHWTEDCCYAQKGGYNGGLHPWEYYFEPVSSLAYEKGDIKNSRFLMPDTPDIPGVFRNERDYFDRELRSIVKTTVIDKYIKIKPNILSKVNSFYEQKMKEKKTVGIHLRGTDRKLNQDKYLMLLDAAERAAKNFSGDVQFFIATDEEGLLDLAKKKLQRTIIYYPLHRSSDESPLHLPKTDGTKLGAVAGEEALIDALLLSKCDFLVHTFSLLPLAVLLFNPTLRYEYISMEIHGHITKISRYSP